MDATSERAPLTSFSTFSQVVEPSVYTPLPDDWLVGMTDVEDSTGAIAAGRYKAVNMAGAAAISAVMNALDHAPFPFIFGGDGTAFAVPPEFGDIAANALARTAAFVRDDLSLNLRVAMVPVSTIRAAGHDVLVGWYAVSDAVRYAVFSGGGLTWAEAEMKAGRFHLPAARPEDRPDLTGLSCRWNRIGAAKGTILSLIVRPQPGADRDAFATLVRRILDLLSAAEREGHPVPSEGPGFRWPPRGCRMEALATKGEQSTLTRMAAIVAIGFLAAVLDKTGRTLGRFDPKHYRRQTALNTDFRKFDDGLRMTVDCAPDTVATITALLEKAEADGIAHFGLHEQKQALMTCIVPSAMTDDHMHFLDGADGGYARAAERLKATAGA